MLKSTDPFVQPWEALGAESVYECRIFTVLKRRSRPPQADRPHDVHVLEVPDWVNVVPITSDGKVVLVRQYRHGISEMTLEVPAGMMEPTDTDPRVAARREMFEETGYDSEEIESLGFTHPNPALQNNRCHMFVARNVTRLGAPQNPPSEHTEPLLVPLSEISAMIQSGAITHALAIAAFHGLSIARR